MIARTPMGSQLARACSLLIDYACMLEKEHCQGWTRKELTEREWSRCVRLCFRLRPLPHFPLELGSGLITADVLLHGTCRERPWTRIAPPSSDSSLHIQRLSAVGMLFTRVTTHGRGKEEHWGRSWAAGWGRFGRADKALLCDAGDRYRFTQPLSPSYWLNVCARYLSCSLQVQRRLCTVLYPSHSCITVYSICRTNVDVLKFKLSSVSSSITIHIARRLSPSL
ncbi:hypothetical protein BDN70DRAFT_563489 [Pholiota conissans]|uniref:Uncharacterized protein n=1 Tax=Pholiota conissans TaxID=109636 RepID=A0A9P6CSX7_9AGAR|nr:hypothetical protein BDN70DRAFT_563489 [Pholiota conissans]